MGRIITEELVRKAVELTGPNAELVLAMKETVWGPTWVEGFIWAPGLGDAIFFTLGEKNDWQPKEEQASSHEVAKRKLAVLVREGVPTSTVVSTQPWCLQEGEFLYAGGATRDGIFVALSGARGRVDEALAEVVISFIRMLAHMEVDRRVANKEMKI